MPYEEIDKEKYQELVSKLKPINWKKLSSEPGKNFYKYFYKNKFI